MKRSLILCLSILLTGSAAAAADTNCDQDKPDRPRQVTMSSSSFLGVDLHEVTGEAAQRLKLGAERGALVTGISAGSAAEKAGLQKDDVIVKWNGETIESVRELSRHVRETPPGRAVRLGVIRDGHEREVNVTLGDRAEYLKQFQFDASRISERLRAQPTVRADVRDGARMGMSLQGMSPQLAEYFGLKDRNGALVTFVHPDSAAAKAGIKAGDVILSVGGETVESPGGVLRVLRTKSEGPIDVKLMRDRQERSVTVQLEKGKASSQIFSPDDFDDVVVSVPRVVIAPLRIAPLPPIAVKIAPLHIAPVVIPKLRIAPIVMPKVVIPRITVPRLMLPPLKIVMPYRVFTNPV